MIRPLVAWLCFIAAFIFMGFDVTDFTITGLFVLGPVFLTIWFVLLGGFARFFGVYDAPEGHPDELHHGHHYAKDHS